MEISWLIIFISLLMSVNVIKASADIQDIYTYSITDGKVTITACSTSIVGEIVIPSTLGDAPVTSIGNDAFRDCISLTKITIPESVESISYTAFSNCSNLQKIIVDKNNSNFSSIDGILFNKNRTSLIYYPKGYALTNYTIPDSVTSIGDGAFWCCSYIESIIIPDSVTSIGRSAFYSCYKLKNIDVDKHNPNFSSNDGVLFNKDKTSILCYPTANSKTNYSIPNSVTNISDSAFSECFNLTNITIPNSVISIGNHAFFQCFQLTTIEIPINVKTIGINAFGLCRKLESIIVDENNLFFSSTNGVLYNKNKTTLICYLMANTHKNYSIPDSVTNIGSYAFYGCSSLTDIIIPSSVISIGDGVFNDCNGLTSVTIPSSVKSIGWWYIPNNENLTLYVEENSFADTYAKANGFTFLYLKSNPESSYISVNFPILPFSIASISLLIIFVILIEKHNNRGIKKLENY